MVSKMPMRQSLIRESTISSAGSTKSTARAASAAVTPGPVSGRPSTKATSGSMRGCRNRPAGIGWCSRWNMLAVR